MLPEHQDIHSILEANGQEHVLRFWPRLTHHQRKELVRQIRGLDFARIRRMQRLLAEGAPSTPPERLTPAPVRRPHEADREAARRAGESLLRAGQGAVLVVAGGQGSRLGFDGPKGCLPVAPVSHASLFAIHARKILALEREFAAPIPFYIMTSETNDVATRAYFAHHGFFGLCPDRVVFFPQGMLPALTSDGRIILDRPDHVFVSPDGHGGVLAALRRTGMLDDMARRGVTAVFYFQVDNPLVEIADPAFMGLHALRRADMSVKVCAKRDPEEGLGVVVERDGRLAVVEYTELTPAQKQARGPAGELRHRYGSVAIHIFALDFLRREAEATLPLHLAHKKVPCVDDQGRTVEPAQANGWKFEQFIFDALPRAREALILEFAREDEFSPIKNADGPDSVATARRDMLRKAARWLAAAGVEVPRTDQGEPLYKVEIDPCFARNPAQLRARLAAGFELTGDVLLR